MTLDDLQREITAGTPVELEVHAVDPMIYVAYLVDGPARTPISDTSGKSIPFRSRYAVSNALREAGAREATFIHRSAYGEMVGMDTETAPTELRETVTL